MRIAKGGGSRRQKTEFNKARNSAPKPRPALSREEMLAVFAAELGARMRDRAKI